MPHIGEFRLVQQMQLSGGIHELKGKRVFVAADALNLASVRRPCDDDSSYRTAWVQDLRAQPLRGCPAGGRKVGACGSAAAVDFVTAGAARFPEEDRFTARRSLSKKRMRRGRSNCSNDENCEWSLHVGIPHVDTRLRFIH
jgi:hypothetical protein